MNLLWVYFSRKQQQKLRYRLDVQLFHLKILWVFFFSYTSVFIYILKDIMLSLSITEHSISRRTFEFLYEFGTAPGKLYPFH